MLVLFCFFENIFFADDLKDLEYDKNRVNTLLRIGQNEKECKELLRIFSKYKDKEQQLNQNLNEVFIAIVRDYSSNSTLLELIKFLEKKVNINYVDSNGYTPLMYAVISSEKVDVAKQLINLGADINMVASATKPPFPYLDIFSDISSWNGFDYVAGISSVTSYKYDFTPLLLAAIYNRNPQMIDLLLESGADKTSIDSYGRNALELAVYYNHNNEIAKRLIEKGFYNLRKSEYSAPLIYLAVIKNDYDLIKTLIEHNTNLRSESFSGKKLIQVVAEHCKNVEIAKLLLKSGLKINDKNILKIAIEKNTNSEVVSFLLQEAYKINEFKQNRNIWSELLQIAILNNSNLDKIIAKLLEMGADPNYIDEYGKNSFLLAVKYYTNYKIFHLLEKYGVNINHLDYDGNNAFRLAVLMRRNYLIEALTLIYKYDVNAKNKYGDNSLFGWFRQNCEVKKKNFALLNILLKLGCDINSTDNEGNTLLIKSASDQSNYDLLQFLLKKGANLEIKNRYGETAIIRAAKSDGLSCNFFALLKAGADINVKDKYGDSLLSSLVFREKELLFYYLYSKSCKSFSWYLLYSIINKISGSDEYDAYFE